MKLGALKTAIRDQEGAPKIRTILAENVRVDLAIQKGSLLAALDQTFPEGRSQETGLFLDPGGHLIRESERVSADESGT